MKTILAALAVCGLACGVRANDESKKLMDEAAELVASNKMKEALAVLEKAVKADPKDAHPHFFAGRIHLSQRANAEAVKAFTAGLALAPNTPEARDARGNAYLKLGMFKEAIADFDAFLESKPQFAPEHWRRGIALYYAGRFADGVKQFDLHRTVNAEDVENSAWHYLCNARATNPKKAREDLIPVTKDARVPMKQVLELFGGKLKPQDVIDAAENSKLQGEELTAARFYAHQYVALYYESEGDKKKALEHLTTAVEKYKISHYMWDVGNAHLDMLKAKKD